MPSDTTTVANSNATTTGSSSRLPSAVCKTRHRCSPCRAASLCTTASPIRSRWPVWGARWAMMWPTSLCAGILSCATRCFLRSAPSCRRLVWLTTWAIRPSVIPAKKPYRLISPRATVPACRRRSAVPSGATSPTSRAMPTPSVFSPIVSRDGATAALS